MCATLAVAGSLQYSKCVCFGDLAVCVRMWVLLKVQHLELIVWACLHVYARMCVHPCVCIHSVQV